MELNRTGNAGVRNNRLHDKGVPEPLLFITISQDPYVIQTQQISLRILTRLFLSKFFLNCLLTGDYDCQVVTLFQTKININLNLLLRVTCLRTPGNLVILVTSGKV
jgi:hypothetical protein